MNYRAPDFHLASSVFHPSSQAIPSDKWLEFKMLLLLDSSGGHPVDLHYERLQLEFLLPNTTSLSSSQWTKEWPMLPRHFTPKDLGSIIFMVDAMDRDDNFPVKNYWHNFNIGMCGSWSSRQFFRTRRKPSMLVGLIVNSSTSNEIHNSALNRSVKLGKGPQLWRLCWHHA